MPAITIEISASLHARMQTVESVDWAAFIASRIEKAIRDSQEARQLAAELEQAESAVARLRRRMDVLGLDRREASVAVS